MRLKKQADRLPNGGGNNAVVDHKEQTHVEWPAQLNSRETLKQRRCNQRTRRHLRNRIFFRSRTAAAGSSSNMCNDAMLKHILDLEDKLVLASTRDELH